MLHDECGKVSHNRSQVSVMLHDECGKVVHRPCSSCISSVQNLIETPSSSSYQLGLEV